MGTTPQTTLPACLTQAGLVGASVALPDYISSRTGRYLAQLALAAGGGLLAARTITTPSTGEPAVLTDQLRQAIGNIGNPGGPDSDSPAGSLDPDSPARTLLLFGGASLLGLLLSRLDAAGRRWAVRQLRKRGVRRPHTVLGVLTAVVVFVINLDQGRA